MPASPNSKWCSGSIRRQTNDPKIKVSDGRWVRLAPGTVLVPKSKPIPRGLYVYETDEVTEREWVSRRREQDGWRNGAKVYRQAA